MSIETAASILAGIIFFGIIYGFLKYTKRGPWKDKK